MTDFSSSLMRDLLDTAIENIRNPTNLQKFGQRRPKITPLTLAKSMTPGLLTPMELAKLESTEDGVNDLVIQSLYRDRAKGVLTGNARQGSGSSVVANVTPTFG